MKLVFTMKLQSDDGQVLAERSGTIENVQRNKRNDIILTANRWVFETYNLFRKRMFSGDKL